MRLAALAARDTTKLAKPFLVAARSLLHNAMVLNTCECRQTISTSAASRLANRLVRIDFADSLPVALCR